MEDTQENWITPLSGPNHYLKYHLQIKTQENGGLWEGSQFIRQSAGNPGHGWHANFSWLLSPLIRVSEGLVILPLLVRRERYPSWMEIVLLLINVKFSYESVSSTQFSRLLLYLVFLKNNQTKITLLPKKHIWGVKFCSPSIPHHILSYLFYFHVWAYHLNWK